MVFTFYLPIICINCFYLPMYIITDILVLFIEIMLVFQVIGKYVAMELWRVMSSVIVAMTTQPCATQRIHVVQQIVR